MLFSPRLVELIVAISAVTKKPMNAQLSTAKQAHPQSTALSLDVTGVAGREPNTQSIMAVDLDDRPRYVSWHVCSAMLCLYACVPHTHVHGLAMSIYGTNIKLP